MTTWNPGIGNWNWNPHPLMCPLFILLQCWHKCDHLKSLTSSGHCHMVLWWCHDWLCCESMHMHLVNWAGNHSEQRCQSGCSDCLFYEGRNVSPRCILWHCSPRYLDMPLHWVSQGRFYFKLCRKSIICTGMYKTLKLNMHKNEAPSFYLYDQFGFLSRVHTWLTVWWVTLLGNFSSLVYDINW